MVAGRLLWDARAMTEADATVSRKARGAELLRKLGRRVRELRRDQGLTQEALAERVGISVDGISQIERGVNFTSMVHAEALAEAVGVPLHELFRLDPVPPLELEAERLLALFTAQSPEVRRAMLEQAEGLAQLARRLTSAN